MENLFNSTGFHWWTGVVEDRMDPLYLGRCRVRVLGYHTKDKTILPTADLPWAVPMQSITSAAVSGIGHSPTGPVEGTWVVGFFADGEDAQYPIFIGTFAGVPQSQYETKIPDKEGFKDPTGKYPLRETLDEPDTNRLARSQKLSETIVQKKKDGRDLKVPIAFGGSWDQPKIPYGAKYPFNHVQASESGHFFELDDTPAAERVHMYHRKGTFFEIDSFGNKVTRVVGNNYEIIEANGNIHIQGKANVTVDGSCNIYVLNNCNLQVDGKLKVHAHGDIEMKSGKNISISAKEKIDIHADKDLNINTKTVMNMKSLKGMNMTGTIKTTIASPILEVAILKMNGMSITPTPPKPPIISPPSTIKPKNPKEQEIISQEFSLTPEERAEIQLEIEQTLKQIEKSTDPQYKLTAKEYVEARKDELDSNQKNSIPVTGDDISPAAACGAASKIIAAAKRDLSVVETGTAKGSPKNYGGKVGGGELPEGVPGRIDEMVRLCGINNADQIKRVGEGYYWCAAAVTAWWKEAGLPVPPGSSGCINWETWGKSKGLFSDKPKLGAAILYGFDKNKNFANHIGIVAAIDADGTVHTIEGNTKGGPGFNRNGCGVFARKSNGNMVRGYVHPPEDCTQPKVDTVESSCISQELRDYIDGLSSKKIPAKVIAELPNVACKFKIDTPLRMSHFLAQCAHESINFTAVRENLSYRAESLMKVFKKYFPTLDLAKQYEKNAEKIANRVYANRMGNGTEESGDGYKYRGRGYIQLTGKSNYQAFRKFIPEDCVENPEIVAEKYPLLSAAWFWSNKNLNGKADTGPSQGTVLAVTKVVNGGTNGLADRLQKFDLYYT